MTPAPGPGSGGVVAAIGVTTLISCLWVVTVNGAVSPQVLAQ